jgi:hypothetical protein
MTKYAYCVTGFARPAKVRACIESILRLDINAPILLFVDRATESSTEITSENIKLISKCHEWKLAGEILDFKVSDTNLVTKRACYEALDWSLGQFEFIVLIEDDLLLTSNPREYLEKSIILMGGNPSIGMACLYSSRNHLGKFESGVRATNWPEMWGNLISRNQFFEISTQVSNLYPHEIRNVVQKYTNKNLMGFLSRIFYKRFQKTWEFKYTKARASKYAWDTEWQLGLWALGKFALAPQVSLVEDTGVDISSVSPLKVDTATLTCNLSVVSNRQGLRICRSCETRREHQNHTIPEFLPKLPILGKFIREGLL